MDAGIQKVLKRTLCAVLVGLVALTLMVVGPTAQQPAQAGAAVTILVRAIAGIITGAAKFGVDELIKSILEKNPELEPEIAQIKQMLVDIDQEFAAVKSALTSMSGILTDMQHYEQQLQVDQALNNIYTFWQNYEQNVFGENATPTDAFLKQFCQNVIFQYNMEASVRTVYNYMSHSCEPRGLLDTYVDTLLTSSSVTGSAADFSTRVETTDGTQVVAERPMYFDYQPGDKNWTGGHDVVGATAPAPAFYFAEGTCRPGFDPYICIQNPGSRNANVTVTYMKGDGSRDAQDIVVGGNSRFTVNVKDRLGEGNDAAHDFSAKVECTNRQGIIAERPMYFNYRPGDWNWNGGHDVVGATAPAPAFYFAEGTCRPGFVPYICIQNPNAADSRVRITYMKGDGATDTQDLVVKASSRFTVDVRDKLGTGDDAAHDFSAKVETNDGSRIVAERPMYFKYNGAWDGGSCVGGLTAPQKKYYFAEGTCRPSFAPYICVQNPGDTDSRVKITFMTGNGKTVEHWLQLPRHSRATVPVKDILGEGNDAAHDFSAVVESTNGTDIVAERPMYFQFNGKWSGGHDVIGASAPASTFYFAEGTVRQGFTPYLCIQNPGATSSHVRVTYMRSDGQQVQKNTVVPAHSRATLLASDSISVLEQQYLGLEDYFTELLHYQTMGADMILEAKNQDPASYGSADQYLNNSFKPMIYEEIGVFRDAVERLVMSQTTLANVPNGSAIKLPTDGQYILDRANFICMIMGDQAFGVTTTQLCGAVIATQDSVPLGKVMGLKARNKSNGITLGASSTTMVPQQAASLNEPYNATMWQKSGMTDYFYDSWASDGQTLAKSNYLSVAWYMWSGVTAGTTYDILDESGNVIATTTVQKYDDNFIQSSSGNNTYGNFTALLRKKAGSDQLMAGNTWSYTTIKDEDNCGRGDNYSYSNLAPKHASAYLYQNPGFLSTPHNTFQGDMSRTFKYSGPDGLVGKVHSDFAVTDLASFVNAHGRSGLQITSSAAGEYVKAHYNFTVQDVTAATVYQGPTKSFEVDGSGGTKSKSVSDDSTQSGNATSVTLYNGHQYKLVVDIYIEGKVTGPANGYGSIDCNISNLYVDFN
jgi:hypothetical protein